MVKRLNSLKRCAPKLVLSNWCLDYHNIDISSVCVCVCLNGSVKRVNIRFDCHHYHRFIEWVVENTRLAIIAQKYLFVWLAVRYCYLPIDRSKLSSSRSQATQFDQSHFLIVQLWLPSGSRDQPHRRISFSLFSLFILCLPAKVCRKCAALGLTESKTFCRLYCFCWCCFVLSIRRIEISAYHKLVFTATFLQCQHLFTMSSLFLLFLTVLFYCYQPFSIEGIFQQFYDTGQ